MSILTLNRSVLFEANPDFSTITDCYSGEKDALVPHDIVQDFIRYLNGL